MKFIRASETGQRIGRPTLPPMHAPRKTWLSPSERRPPIASQYIPHRENYAAALACLGIWMMDGYCPQQVEGRI